MFKHPETQRDLYTKEEIATLLCMTADEFDAYWKSKQQGLEEGKEYEVFIYADVLPTLIDEQDA